MCVCVNVCVCVLTFNKDTLPVTRSHILCFFDVTSISSQLCIRVLLTDAADTGAAVKHAGFLCFVEDVIVSLSDFTTI